MSFSFYWHDYETWGADPSRDRAAQFAGIRTDADLRVIGKPLMVYCKPADDMLPQPEACLITGITPQIALTEGVVEAEFFALVHQQLSTPGTCGVGYNSIRFDDEVTRYGLYRNLYDPYGREWQNGNSRWDIIDMVRATHALRPQGINWPSHADGTASFRLEQLTGANGITHEGAHDALADVYATIDLARLIRQHQPRLFDYLLQLRDKRKVAGLLSLPASRPLLHVSSMYPASRGCIAQVLPLARHPTNNNGVIVFDLASDPAPLLQLSAAEIALRLFTPTADLPAGVERIALKTVHLNKSPVVAPMGTLTDEMAERWGIDRVAGQQRVAQLQAETGLAKKIQQVFQQRQFEPIPDPDRALYSGGFFSDSDRRLLERLRGLSAAELSTERPRFEDPRLDEMLFRYRARNWPDSLDRQERERWQVYRMQRLTQADGGGTLTLADYRQQLAQLMVADGVDQPGRAILSALADWPEQIGLD